MMTETTVECRFDKACSSYLPNRTLENAMYQALSHFGTPEWNCEELAFAKQIQARSPPTIANSLNNIAVTVAKTARLLHYSS
ncbi:aminobenzoyl-glutamate utilization protein B [Escherichia coli]|uniref:Aminobenzoyl-glutamate utilization protein B n=1 Tax=Escherichia coli TaxID=562 RepID=A0A376MY06_ECOLX|nr:aminobenzoyl-glutamate utilization protein B [Escherichia coli]